MEEDDHLISVISDAKQCLTDKNSSELKSLSNQIIHQASIHQDTGCITLAVLIYTLSKLIERKDYDRLENWDKFVKEIGQCMDSAVNELEKGKENDYENYLEKARMALSSISGDLKPYIQEVLRKASINKASKIYDHGISMERTAKMLGVTQWELSEYAGGRQAPDSPFNETIDVKKRAKMALEFLS